MNHLHPKPRVRLRGYRSDSYNVLVCDKEGNVFVIWAGFYKPAAYRQSSQVSPRNDMRTHRCCVIGPREPLTDAVNFLITDWAPSRAELTRHLLAHPDHAPNYPAGHDFVLRSTADVHREHERQHEINKS